MYHFFIHPVHFTSTTGEKPFQCQFCPKTFRQPGQRRTHERVHTREASYICEICDRGFLYWTSLRVHRNTHYKDRPPEEAERLIKAPIIAKDSKRPPPRGRGGADGRKTSSKRKSAGKKRGLQEPAPEQDVVSVQNNQGHHHSERGSSSQNVIQPHLIQNIHQTLNIPIQLTIESNPQQMQQQQSVIMQTDHLTSQQIHQQRDIADEANTSHQQMSSAPGVAGAPGLLDSQWETMHNRYLNNPQTWQHPPNWQGLPGATTSATPHHHHQPMQNPGGNWEMPPAPHGNWVGPPPPAHQGHASASSILTNTLYGIIQRDNDGRVYQQ